MNRLLVTPEIGSTGWADTSHNWWRDVPPEAQGFAESERAVSRRSIAQPLWRAMR